MVKEDSGQNRAVSADSNMGHYIVSRLELHVLSTLTLSADSNMRHYIVSRLELHVLSTLHAWSSCSGQPAVKWLNRTVDRTAL